VIERERPLPPSGSDSTLIDMIRAASDPDIIYELKPGLDCRFSGVEVVTSSAGFRGPERALEKTESTFRVLALGDSVLFGWGVPWPETGIALLEARLQELLPARAVEVIGTGVPGYNTAIEAAVLRTKGLAWRPDVVLVDFVGNDYELPTFLLAPTNYWRVDHCYLLDLAWRMWRSAWRDPRSPFVRAPDDPQGLPQSDPARVPADYRHLVGPEAYRRALTDIQALGRAHGFRVLVTSHSGLDPGTRALVDSLGIPVAQAWTRVSAWMHEHGVETFIGPPLTISDTDAHPAALLHGFWAESVAEALGELGWLPR
jgi:hypothetical protein